MSLVAIARIEPKEVKVSTVEENVVAKIVQENIAVRVDGAEVLAAYASAASAAADRAEAAADSFEYLLTIAQRAQSIYGLNDFAGAFLFARQGVELLFTSGYYRNGLVVK